MTDEERQFRIPDAPGMTDNGRIMKLADYVSKLQAWGEQCQWTAKSILQSYDELKAENAALREIVRALAEMPTPDAKRDDGLLLQGRCPWCKGTGEWLGSKLRHTPDCPVTKARALLASEG